MATPESEANAGSDPALDLVDTARVQVEEWRKRSGSHVRDSIQGEIYRGVAGLRSDSLPGYELGLEIHRGGQGVVYAAVQSATGRKVAIKMLRQGALASRHGQARLEREVQILESLNHPNIVGVIDRGSSADHRYFVMDYVDGQPLDVFAAGLEQGQILELFFSICEAVHTAHLRGVLHRDLKPANILIDREGQPKILDFGLAKIMGPEADFESPNTVTMTGQFVGSLPWASPEQAAGGGQDERAIDIRSDVYSLGVMLYQLLTGSFPYRVIGAMRDVQDNIIHAEPIRPGAVNGAIDDELETIVLKCLCKEPERRYQSAGELGRDLRHYLADEPIEAKGDSFGYLLKKQMRRHRAAVMVAAAFMLLVAASSVVSLSLWRSAVRERDQKEAERAKAESVNAVLRNMLASANPEVSNGRELTVMEVLGVAARDIEVGSLRDFPAVEASVRLTMGESYLALGKLEPASHHLHIALKLLEQTHGRRHPESAVCMGALGRLCFSQGNFTQAAAYQEEAIGILRLAEPPRYEIPWLMKGLAGTLDRLGRRDEASVMQQQALELMKQQRGENHPETARMETDVATFQLGSEQAVPLLEKALATYRATLGPKHPEVARTLRKLGAELHLKGRYQEAEAAYLEALELCREIYGLSHPEIPTIVMNLHWLYDNAGQKEKGPPLMRLHEPSALATYGRDSVNYAQYLYIMGWSVARIENVEEGEAMLGRSLEILKLIGKDSTWHGAECRVQLATIHLGKGEYDAAEGLARETIAITDLSDRGRVRRVKAQGILAEVLYKRGEFEEAEGLLTECEQETAGRRTLATERARTIERFVELYEEWNAAVPSAETAGKAAIWREKLASEPTGSLTVGQNR